MMPSIVPESKQIKDTAEEFANKIKELGFEADVKHSGSKAGASSYVSVSDPTTGRFVVDPYRFSGHSKGPYQAQFVNEVSDLEKQFPDIEKTLMEMREKGPAAGLQKQQLIQQKAEELIKDGVKPKTAYKQATEMAEKNSIFVDTLENVVAPLKEKGLTLDIYESKNNPNKLVLSKIEVPKELRKSGVGSNAMQELTGFADKENKTITLSPSTDFGGSSVSRLKDFYKRFGFVENKGRYKDYSISESMYRLPTKLSRKDIIEEQVNNLK
jgi:predicted GNAT family N-acyltransferase